MQDNEGKKRSLTIGEKTAILFIVILIIVILLLIFNKQLKEYFEIFKAWYESA
jgi:hypothetical protein